MTNRIVYRGVALRPVAATPRGRRGRPLARGRSPQPRQISISNSVRASGAARGEAQGPGAGVQFRTLLLSSSSNAAAGPSSCRSLICRIETPSTRCNRLISASSTFTARAERTLCRRSSLLDRLQARHRVPGDLRTPRPARQERRQPLPQPARKHGHATDHQLQQALQAAQQLHADLTAFIQRLDQPPAAPSPPSQQLPFREQ